MADLTALRDSTTDGTLPAYVWPGGYPMEYLTEAGLIICPKCANDPDTSDPVVDGDVYWEGPAIVCDDGSQCGAMVAGTWQAGLIESAYGDPEAPDMADPADSVGARIVAGQDALQGPVTGSGLGPNTDGHDCNLHR